MESSSAATTRSSPWIAVLLLFVAAAAVVTVVLMNRGGEKGSGLGGEFDYDLDPLRVTDPALILYTEAGGALDTGLVLPSSLAVGPDDRIYVAGGRKIIAFNCNGGRHAFEIALDAEPRCLAVAGDGTVYVGLGDHVERFDSSGKLTKRFESAGPEALLTSIVLDENRVYVAEFKKKEILVYDTDGNRQGEFGEFVIPSPFFDLARSEDGLIHVTNTGEHRIDAYRSDGNLESFWGEFSNTDVSAFSGCCNPVNIALLPAGGGFVTAEKGLTRVKVYDGEGVFLGVVAGPECFVRHDRLCAAPGYDLTRVGHDVAVDSTGRVLVLDHATAEVRFFEKGENR
jgi:hypothetical protein